jgi:hypothetical protein
MVLSLREADEISKVFFLRDNFIKTDPDPIHSVQSSRNTLCSNIKKFRYRKRILHTTTKNTAASKLMFIKLLMYLFF